MNVFRAAAALIVLLGLGACNRLEVKDLEEGERGIVADVLDGDTLALDNGLRVQLTGIEAPRREAPLAREARAGLERLAMGREARLFYGGERRWRETTALAQVYVRSEGGRWIWLQEAMALEGLARAHSFKETAARAPQLLAAEAAARAAGRGIWAEPYFAVRDPDSVAADIGSYQVVKGRIRRAQATEQRLYLNFGDDYRSDFTIALAAEDVAAWADPAITPEALEGKMVRVRGYVADRGGPLIVVDHRAQLEIAPGA